MKKCLEAAHTVNYFNKNLHHSSQEVNYCISTLNFMKNCSYYFYYYIYIILKTAVKMYLTIYRKWSVDLWDIFTHYKKRFVIRKMIILIIVYKSKHNILIEHLNTSLLFDFRILQRVFVVAALSHQVKAPLFCNTTNDDKDNLKLDTKISKKINNR